MAIKINLMPNKQDIANAKNSQQPLYFLIISAFFIISVLVFLGIYSYNTFVLQKQLDSAVKQNADIEESISNAATPEELATVISAVTKGKSVQSILSAHLYVSKIYELLEKITIKTIVYTKFSEKINTDNTVNVSVTGTADSFGELTKQLIVFKKTKEVKKIIFDEGSVDKNGKVSFSVNLTFDIDLITVVSK